MTLTPQSERLNFAMMTEDDGGLMLDLDSDPEVMRYITDGKTSTEQDIQEIYIPRMLSYTNVDKGWGLWETFRKEGITKLVGIALPGNIGSRKIMGNIGMSYIKTYVHEDPLFKTTVVLYEGGNPGELRNG